MDNNITSYFGVQGNTFYAGPNGASFQIKSSAKFGNYRELLNNSVASILIGDYLLVNYGNQADPTDTSSSPNHKSYGENMAIDAYSGSGTNPLPNVDPLSRPGYYNATIWQKTGEGQYELVFGCASAAPNISIVTDSANAINPGSLENAEIITKNLNSSVMSQEFKLKPINPWNIDFEPVVGNPSINPSISLKNDGSTETKTFTVTLPKAWNIDPEVTVHEIDSTESAFASFESSNNNDTKKLTLNLPAPWDFSSNVSVISANATENASASIGEIEEDEQDKKQLTLTIPSIWNIDIGDNSFVGFNQNPSVSLDQKQHSSSSDSLTTKYLHFSLPKAPNLTTNYEIVDSMESGGAEGVYTDDNTTYQFNFRIPKGSKIKAGTALFNTETGQVTFLQNEDPLNGLLKGDFYINSTLGTIYEITSANNHTYTIENKGSFQIPGFTIHPNALSTTYNVTESNGTFSITPNIPSQSIEVNKPANPDENWTINLPVINPPTSNYSIQLVSSATQGGVNITSPQTGIINYDINIPRGSRIFSGADKTTTLANQSFGTGDYFFSTRSKKLFALDDAGNTLSETLLSGDSFAIYHLGNQNRWNVTQSQLGLQNPSEEDIVAAIKLWLSTQLLDANPQPNQFSEMVDVLYTDNSNNNTSYWLYKTGEGSEDWNAIRLSADAGSSIIENVTYSTSRNSSTTTYSAAWINALKTDLNNSITNRTTEARVNTLIANAIDAIDIGSPAIQWGTWDSQGNITWPES